MNTFGSYIVDWGVSLSKKINIFEFGMIFMINKRNRNRFKSFYFFQ